MRRRVALMAGVAAPLLLGAAPMPAEHVLRVCADPNNLPFSNQAKEGFENKLADLVAHELGDTVSYTWWAQRRGFVRHTLKAGTCDVIMGVPVGYELTATTRPYYRSSYVFVSRADHHIGIASLLDPRLRALRIGVQLIGDDGFNTPPAHALSDEGMTRNIVGFPVYGDYREPNPPARIVDAVAAGRIDLAAVWGPLAGYFAQRSPVKLTLAQLTGTAGFRPLRFQFAIAMGVRKGDHALRDRLDAVIAQKQPEITALLASYGVPLVPMVSDAEQ